MDDDHVEFQFLYGLPSYTMSIMAVGKSDLSILAVAQILTYFLIVRTVAS